MAVIMRHDADEIVPIEYIDSILSDSYRKATNDNAVKFINELKDIEYGSLDMEEYLTNTLYDEEHKESCYRIIRSTTNGKYVLTVYKINVHKGYIYNSYSTKELAKFYYVKCKRTVPKMPKMTTLFDDFCDELKARVSIAHK
jgi:hypothetical protein